MIITVTLNPVLDRTYVVPRLQFDDVLRSTPARLDWGGKGFNVSRALQALGAGSLAMGFLGGATGDKIAAGLRDLGIKTDFTLISGETRTNIVILEESRSSPVQRTGRHLKINEPGPAILPLEIDRFLSQVDTHLAAGCSRAGQEFVHQTWIFSGSLPPGVPPDIYATLIHRVQSACQPDFHARAVLDTSGEALRLGLLARPYLIKPNRQEAESITGFSLKTRRDLDRAGAIFLDMGVQIVAISLGADGLYCCWDRALLQSKEHAILVSAKPVQGGNPTGAGDALLAGLVYALEYDLLINEGGGFVDAARFAVTCGTAAAEGPGVELPANILSTWTGSKPTLSTA
jgi:1-phosphofructokinase family hexose kinase